MADSMPNYRVEKARIRMQISQQQANIDRQTFDILEMEDRIARHQENIDASKKAIAQLEETLASLDAAHPDKK